jgi:hypothetical protein
MTLACPVRSAAKAKAKPVDTKNSKATIALREVIERSDIFLRPSYDGWAPPPRFCQR